METGYFNVSGNYVPGELSFPVALTGIAFTFGVLGIFGPAWGYALLLIATLLLLVGCALVAVLVLTHALDTDWLKR